MRRALVISLASLLIVPVLAVAQSGPAISFGVMAGGAVTSFDGLNTASKDLFNGTATVKSRTGFLAGGYLRASLTSMFSVQPEVYFIQKGADITFGGTGQAAGVFKTAMSFVEVPVLLHVNLMTTGSVRPFIVVGPSFAQRIGCSLDLSGNSLSKPLKVDCDKIPDGTANGYQADIYKKSDMGGIVGIGVGTSKFAVQGRYSRGFTTINSDQSTGQKGNTTAFSLVLSIGM